MTKKQRKAVYEGMVEFIERGIERLGESSDGFCTALYLCDIDGIADFPELMQFKPKRNMCGAYWFPLGEEWTLLRLNLLALAIKECC